MRRADYSEHIASLRAQAQMVEVAEVLFANHVDVMPLKGLWLQHYVYESKPRPMGDIDILIRPSQRKTAIQALLSAGYQVIAEDNQSSVLRLEAQLAYLVDLHWGLFMPGLFHLPTSHLFTRATMDAAFYGGQVWTMHALDVYAHLIGHFAKERLNDKAERALEDLRLAPDHLALNVETTLHHLRAAQMLTAARYVLPFVCQRQPHAFSTELFEALPTRVARKARSVERLVKTRPQHWKTRWMATHGLNDSRLGFIYSTSHHVYRVLKRAVSRIMPEVDVSSKAPQTPNQR